MRQHVTHRVHNVDCAVRIRNANMYVESEGEQRTCDHLVLFHDQFISGILENLLILPMRERMSAGSDNLQSLPAHQTRNDTAQVCDIGSSFFYVFADSGAHFDHRLDHFGFDLLTEQHLALFQDFRDMRTQFAGTRINNLKLFFNTECELLEHASVTFFLSDRFQPYSLPSFSKWFGVDGQLFFHGWITGVVSRASLATTFYTSPDE